MEVNGASAVNYLTNTTQKDVIRTQPIFSLIWDYGTPQIKFMSKKKKETKIKTRCFNIPAHNVSLTLYPVFLSSKINDSR